MNIKKFLVILIPIIVLVICLIILLFRGSFNNLDNSDDFDVFIEEFNTITEEELKEEKDKNKQISIDNVNSVGIENKIQKPKTGEVKIQKNNNLNTDSQQVITPANNQIQNNSVPQNKNIQHPDLSLMGDVDRYYYIVNNMNPSLQEMYEIRDKLIRLRNDTAVGAIDPYEVFAKRGITASPQMIERLEIATASIYDPLIKDINFRIEGAQRNFQSLVNDLQNSLMNY